MKLISEKSAASIVKILLFLFFSWGVLYPTVRVELIGRTGLPSALLGSWQDVLIIAIVAFSLLSNRRFAIVDGALVFGITLVGIGFITALLSIFAGISFKAIVYAARLTYFPMLFFFVGKLLPFEPKDFRRLHWGIASICAVTAFLGLILSYVATDYWIAVVTANVEERDWGLHAIAREGALRMTGTLLDPVSFASICAYGVIFSSVLMLERGRKTKALFAGVLTAFCSAGVFLSLSRGVWGMLIVSLFAAALGSSGKNLRLKFVAGVAAMLFAAGCIITLIYPDLLLSTWEKTVKEGNIQRQEMWAEALGAFMDNPMGLGLGTVGHIGERFKDENAIALEITDGWYLKVLAEGGLVLLLCFIALQFVIMRKTIYLQKREVKKEIAAYRMCAFCVLAGSSVQAVASNIWDLYLVSHALWLIAGISINRASRPVSDVSLAGTKDAQLEAAKGVC